MLGKVESLTTVKQLIDAAHAHNIAAMPYTAIYGASYAFYNQHPDWALFEKKDQAYDFAGFLKILEASQPAHHHVPDNQQRPAVAEDFQRNAYGTTGPMVCLRSAGHAQKRSTITCIPQAI